VKIYILQSDCVFNYFGFTNLLFARINIGLVTVKFKIVVSHVKTWLSLDGGF
jgi:hypothetical protein